MNSEIITTIILVVVVVAILCILFKAFIKVIVALGVTYLLFHVAFIWGADEIKQSLPFEKFLKPQYAEQISSGLDDFVEKRDEMGMLDKEAVKTTIDNVIKDAALIAGNKIAAIDKEALIEDVKEVVLSLGIDDVSRTLNELELKLREYGLTEQEIDEILMAVTE